MLSRLLGMSSNEPHSPTHTAHPFCYERELFCFRIPAINKCSILKPTLDLRAGGVFLSNFILRCKISPGIVIKSRDLSAEKAGENLKLFKQPAQTSDLLLDVILAERVPIGRRIDGNHRLVEPHLGGGGEPHHAQIGADLD